MIDEPISVRSDRKVARGVNSRAIGTAAGRGVVRDRAVENGRQAPVVEERATQVGCVATDRAIGDRGRVVREVAVAEDAAALVGRISTNCAVDDVERRVVRVNPSPGLSVSNIQRVVANGGLADRGVGLFQVEPGSREIARITVDRAASERQVAVDVEDAAARVAPLLPNTVESLTYMLVPPAPKIPAPLSPA